MASTIPPIYVEIMADVDKLKAGLKDATDGIKRMDDGMARTSSGLSTLTRRMTQFAAAAGAAFVSQRIVSFAKDAIQAASDFGENVDKVSVVFGKNAAAIEKWSQSASTAMIMSQNEALSAAGTYGNLFRAIGLTEKASAEMSMTMVQLAADMASFNNANPEEVLVALRAGLVGEAEPLKRFGVNVNQAAIELEALNMGLIKSGEKLSFAGKAQAAYSLILKQTALQQGNVALTADSTANRQKSLAAQFEDTKRKIGEGLMPVYRGLQNLIRDYVLPAFAAFGDFLIRNKDAIKTALNAVVILGGGLAALIVVVKAAQKAQQAYIAVTAVMTGSQGIATAATNALTAAMGRLNMVLRSNPVGLIVTAVGLLAAGFVALWNRSETFRRILIALGQGGLIAIGSLIGLFGDLAKGILHITTGPIQLLLKGLAMLGNERAQRSLDILRGSIDTVGNFFENAGNKVAGYAKSLEGLSKKRFKMPNLFGDTGAIMGAMPTVPEIEAGDMAALNKDTTKSAEKIANAVNTARKRIKDLRRDVIGTLTDYTSNLAEADKDRLEGMADAQERYNEQVTAAQKRNTERLVAIAKRYAERVADIEKTLADKTTELRERAASRAAELREQAARKEADILRQSVDRLRSAFEQGTQFDLQAAFKAGPSADALVKTLKDRLAAARDLQENAAALAGMGYSQTFIEQVVKNGPDAGNAIAKALREASPEATAELQALYGQVETISDSGLNALAESMNRGGNLATAELRKAYAQVAVDLQKSLDEVNAELNTGLAEAQAAYQASMLEAARERDEALAEAQKDLAEALAEAQKDLSDTLLEIQKSYDEAVMKIVERTNERLADLRRELIEAGRALRELDAAAGKRVIAQARKISPVTAPSAPAMGTSGSTTSVTNNTVNITNTSTVSDQAVADMVLAAIRIGQAVTTGPSSMVAV